jgi:hypothetical protein
MSMVTIQNLDVRFDVEGDGDEQTFARLFEAHIRRWHRQETERRARDRLSEAERSLGDRGRRMEDM